MKHALIILSALLIPALSIAQEQRTITPAVDTVFDGIKTGRWSWLPLELSIKTDAEKVSDLDLERLAVALTKFRAEKLYGTSTAAAVSVDLFSIETRRFYDPQGDNLLNDVGVIKISLDGSQRFGENLLVRGKIYWGAGFAAQGSRYVEQTEESINDVRTRTGCADCATSANQDPLKLFSSDQGVSISVDYKRLGLSLSSSRRLSESAYDLFTPNTDGDGDYQMKTGTEEFDALDGFRTVKQREDRVKLKYDLVRRNGITISPFVEGNVMHFNYSVDQHDHRGDGLTNDPFSDQSWVIRDGRLNRTRVGIQIRITR